MTTSVVRNWRWVVCVSALAMGAATRATAQVNVVELTAKEIAAGYAAGSLTAVQVTQAFLDRIAAYESNYNAFVSFNPDALATAAALDEELLTRGSRGPLHGVPIVIKESMDVAGLPSTAGYRGFSSQAGGVDLVPQLDATVVTRLKDAGAIILGKTNIPDFSADDTRAYSSWAGWTFNAYNRTIAPGASSSGTATAVAASFAVLGMAEETGGSIQNPASAQGLVGIKTTFGLVPTTGVTPVAASTRDVLGPHAKTVYDAAIALDAIAGYTPEDPKTEVAIGNLPVGGYTRALSESALQGKRIGLFGPGWRRVTLAPENQAHYDQAKNVLAAEGATLIEDPFAGSAFAGLTPQPGYDVRGFESWVYDYEKYLERLRPTAAENSLQELKDFTGVDLFGAQGPLAFGRNFVPAASLNNPDLPPDLSGFAKARARFRDVFAQVMDTHQLDALVFPQMRDPTPPLVGSATISALTVDEINILGTPGITVPAGYYANGSPFNLIFLGEPFSEAELLGYAYDYEQATQHRKAPTLAQLGDFDGNGVLDVLDIDALSSKLRTTDIVFDVNADNRVNSSDIFVWVKELAKTYLGDANVDGTFSSGDLLAVLQAGEYEDTLRRNSVWSEGDWDGDREATSRDIVLAFQEGAYEQEPRATTTAVPEPSTQLLLLLAAACLLLVRIHTGRPQQVLLHVTPPLPDQNVREELTAKRYQGASSIGRFHTLV